jgi:hypothetical protein
MSVFSRVLAAAARMVVNIGKTTVSMKALSNTIRSINLVAGR